MSGSIQTFHLKIKALTWKSDVKFNLSSTSTKFGNHGVEGSIARDITEDDDLIMPKNVNQMPNMTRIRDGEVNKEDLHHTIKNVMTLVNKEVSAICKQSPNLWRNFVKIEKHVMNIIASSK